MSDEGFNQTGEKTVQPPVEVPVDVVSADALSGIIDEFILREGTDYGAQETSHEAKVARVRRQLEAGEVKVVFDPNNETVNLLTELEWRRLTRERG